MKSWGGPLDLKAEAKMMLRVIEELQSEVELLVSHAGDQRYDDDITRIWKFLTGCIAEVAQGIFMYWLTGHEQIRCEDSSRGTKPCRRCVDISRQCIFEANDHRSGKHLCVRPCRDIPRIAENPQGRQSLRCRLDCNTTSCKKAGTCRKRRSRRSRPGQFHKRG